MKKLHDARVLAFLSPERISTLIRDPHAQWVLSSFSSARPLGPLMMAWQCVSSRPIRLKPLMHFRGTTLLPELREVLRKAQLNEMGPDTIVLLFKTDEKPHPSLISSEISTGRKPYAGHYRLVTVAKDKSRTAAVRCNLFFQSPAVPRPFAGLKNTSTAPFFSPCEQIAPFHTLWCVAPYSKLPVSLAFPIRSLTAQHLLQTKLRYVQHYASDEDLRPALSLYCAPDSSPSTHPACLLEAEPSPYTELPADLNVLPSSHIKLWQQVAAWLSCCDLIDAKVELSAKTLSNIIASRPTEELNPVQHALEDSFTLLTASLSTCAPSDFPTDRPLGVAAYAPPYDPLGSYLIATVNDNSHGHTRNVALKVACPHPTEQVCAALLRATLEEWTLYKHLLHTFSNHPDWAQLDWEQYTGEIDPSAAQFTQRTQPALEASLLSHSVRLRGGPAHLEEFFPLTFAGIADLWRCISVHNASAINC